MIVLSHPHENDAKDFGPLAEGSGGVLKVWVV